MHRRTKRGPPRSVVLPFSSFRSATLPSFRSNSQEPNGWLVSSPDGQHHHLCADRLHLGLRNSPRGCCHVYRHSIALGKPANKGLPQGVPRPALLRRRPPCRSVWLCQSNCITPSTFSSSGLVLTESDITNENSCAAVRRYSVSSRGSVHVTKRAPGSARGHRESLRQAGVPSRET